MSVLVIDVALQEVTGAWSACVVVPCQAASRTTASRAHKGRPLHRLCHVVVFSDVMAHRCPFASGPRLSFAWLAGGYSCVVGKCRRDGVCLWMTENACVAVRARVCVSPSHVQFLKDEIRAVAATLAFGMGIDKPDIRMVVHAGLPKNVESYAQQIGRAGRDGLPCRCIMFVSSADIQTLLFLQVIQTIPCARSLSTDVRLCVSLLLSSSCVTAGDGGLYQ